MCFSENNRQIKQSLHLEKSLIKEPLSEKGSTMTRAQQPLSRGVIISDLELRAAHPQEPIQILIGIEKTNEGNLILLGGHKITPGKTVL
jgi:hypothetical protein